MSDSDVKSVVEGFRCLSDKEKTATYIDIDVIWKALQAEVVGKPNLDHNPK
jgi:hypothetical protein